MKTRNFFLSVLIFTLVFTCAAASEVLFVRENADSPQECVNVFLDGAFFTAYLPYDGENPILFPILGPTSERMTRNYPMIPGDPTEATDHWHHRSFWCTHGELNDVNFWCESKNRGFIRHEEYLSLDAPTLKTRNRWENKDGKIICTDERTYTFGGDEAARWVDFEIRMIASHGDLHFGDTKEAFFGVRVPGTMSAESKLGGKIITSRGDTDDAAWGAVAEWTDYSGPVHGKTLGIAIFQHPSSAFYPTRWMVRTYGLFAANPFGGTAFTGDAADSTEFILKNGDSFTLKFRVYFHSGNEIDAKIADVYRTYAESKTSENSKTSEISEPSESSETSESLKISEPSKTPEMPEKKEPLQK